MWDIFDTIIDVIVVVKINSNLVTTECDIIKYVNGYFKYFTYIYP